MSFRNMALQNLVSTRKQFKPLALSLAITLALSACGGDDDSKPAVEPVTPTPVTPVLPVVEEQIGEPLTLEQVTEHISGSEPVSFYVDVAEDSPTLVVSLFNGTANEALGDPDVYVKYDEPATAGETGNFDCVSYNGTGDNEACIIDNPVAGRYHILVDAYEGSATVDASILATTSIFNHSRLCNDSVRIRSQAMTDEQIDSACAVLSETKIRFDDVLSALIAPEFGQAVENDLNETTNFNVFASLSNHAVWSEHLFDTSNTSGIYFETSPTDWWHDSTVLTFNALEWSGGRDVIRSLDHEYIHALDGRYNKEGGYRKDMAWWSEGLAEYLGTFYEEKYQSLITANEAQKYTLAEIFAGESNAYSWGELAVGFLIETQAETVTQMLSLMRAGDWDGYYALLDIVSAEKQAEFETWYSTELATQFNTSNTALALGEYSQINGRGGWLYSVTVPEGTDSITFKTQGGSGNVDLWVNQAQAFHPSIDSSATCESMTIDSNSETCTLDVPNAGEYYVTIGSDFVGGDIIDLYLSACAGVDCNVNLPAAEELKQATEPYLPHWPAKGTLGTCSLAETYRNSYTDVTDFAITNTTDTAVKVYWLSTKRGDKAGSSYMTLAQGDSFSPNYWRVGERVMLTDMGDNCLSVAILNDSDNQFEILAGHVVDAVDEIIIPQATAEMGSCDLAVPYTRQSGNAPEFIVANISDTPYTLYWIDTDSGEPNLGNIYATLNLNEMYSADFWTIGDRMMVTDNDDQCVGVLDLNETSNIFVLE